jgi:nitronate monooxygenase
VGQGSTERGSRRSAMQKFDYLGGDLAVPRLADRVDVPVIARVQIGAAFLGCEESGASRLHRQALLEKNAEHTALTKGITGRLARGIQNRLMEELNGPGAEILPYPLQRGLFRKVAIPAEAAGRSDPCLCGPAKVPVSLIAPTCALSWRHWLRKSPKSRLRSLTGMRRCRPREAQPDSGVVVSYPSQPLELHRNNAPPLPPFTPESSVHL